MVLVYGVTLRRSRPRFRGQDPQSSACIGDSAILDGKDFPQLPESGKPPPEPHGSAARV